MTVGTTACSNNSRHANKLFIPKSTLVYFRFYKYALKICIQSQFVINNTLSSKFNRINASISVLRKKNLYQSCHLRKYIIVILIAVWKAQQSADSIFFKGIDERISL